jgi:hypothetical protein
MASQNTDTAESVIIAPDGSVDTVPAIIISDADATLLREYKKFLLRQGLREALYCQHCWSGERHDGCKAYVTDAEIAIVCRCRNRFHRGQSF